MALGEEFLGRESPNAQQTAASVSAKSRRLPPAPFWHRPGLARVQPRFRHREDAPREPESESTQAHAHVKAGKRKMENPRLEDAPLIRNRAKSRAGSAPWCARLRREWLRLRTYAHEARTAPIRWPLPAHLDLNQ